MDRWCIGIIRIGPSRRRRRRRVFSLAHYALIGTKEPLRLSRHPSSSDHSHKLIKIGRTVNSGNLERGVRRSLGRMNGWTGILLSEGSVGQLVRSASRRCDVVGSAIYGLRWRARVDGEGRRRREDVSWSFVDGGT